MSREVKDLQDRLHAAATQSRFHKSDLVPITLADAELIQQLVAKVGELEARAGQVNVGDICKVLSRFGRDGWVLPHIRIFSDGSGAVSAEKMITHTTPEGEEYPAISSDFESLFQFDNTRQLQRWITEHTPKG